MHMSSVLKVILLVKRLSPWTEGAVVFKKEKRHLDNSARGNYLITNMGYRKEENKKSREETEDLREPWMREAFPGST